MTPDPTRTLGAITPEYAEAGGNAKVDKASALVEDDIAYWLGNPFMTPDLLADKVCWWIERTTNAAATAVLTAARNLCCGEHPSAHHAATDAHSRVMAIAERLADAARGLG